MKWWAFAWTRSDECIIFGNSGGGQKDLAWWASCVVVTRFPSDLREADLDERLVSLQSDSPGHEQVQASALGRGQVTLDDAQTIFVYTYEVYDDVRGALTELTADELEQHLRGLGVDSPLKEDVCALTPYGLF
eukprot:TRINITY_DN2973_c0_g1_i1.p1 TRINITY_DN2973_c0_g1~~TRINITY_DN2973_c0_g1_i1.p1  ORF type:complete len:133 (+),score=22.02 TRINITY_DN2973_c0_g1_i1:324-722(+)